MSSENTFAHKQAQLITMQSQYFQLKVMQSKGWLSIGQMDVLHCNYVCFKGSGQVQNPKQQNTPQRPTIGHKQDINFSIIPIILAGTGRQQSLLDHPSTERKKMQIQGSSAIVMCNLIKILLKKRDGKRDGFRHIFMTSHMTLSSTSNFS